MLEKSRRDRVWVGTNAVKRHFNEATLAIPCRIGIGTVKIFEPIKNSEDRKTADMPQVEVIYQLYENSGKAVACKEFLICAA